MSRSHPERATLLQLGRVELPRSEVRALIRHLLRGCSACADAAAVLFPPAAVPRTRRTRMADYDGAFLRAERAVMARQLEVAEEQAAAGELLAGLAAHPFERQRMLVVCAGLIEAAQEAGFHDAARAVELAELAVAATGKLDAATYGSERVHDLMARAWTALGTARRIRSHFRDATAAFLRAERLLRQGSGDPLEKATLLLSKASLLGDQRRFAEAFRLLDRGAALARRAGDRHLEGKGLIGKGVFLGHSGDAAGAIETLRRGLELTDPAVEFRLVVAGHHNLIHYLVESGRLEEATAAFERARPLYDRFEDRLGRLRVGWLEAKLARGAGRLDEAEAGLLAVREQMLARDLGYDVGLVSLDLIEVYLRQGRTGEVRRLAEEILPLFAARDVQREALVALTVLQRAAVRERVTVGLVREVSDLLCRTRVQAGLKFRDAG
jgi:tetratricopeptide (TPR) repeat protein